MQKVRELYAKYNLEQIENPQRQEFVHLSIVTGKKRTEAHEDRILSILLEHFFVEVLTSKLFDPETTDEYKAIELIGTRENVLMAEYVYHFLIQQSDFWVREKIKNSGKKLSRFDRKSLRLGLLEGFSEKLLHAEKATERATEETRKQISPESAHSNLNPIGTALALFQGNPALKNYLSTIYPRLRYSRSSGAYIDPSLYREGKEIGKSITLKKAIISEKKTSGRFLE